VPYAPARLPQLRDRTSWCREETLRKVLSDLANTLLDEGEIDQVGMQPSFDFYMIEGKPENLIGDRATTVISLTRSCDTTAWR
jgi:hypothetical protein